jgi:hypothetical protein
MTALAAMLGALPLALGAGDGAEVRRPLGISIVGGLIFSQVLTLYTTPVVYLHLDRLRSWFRGLSPARRAAASAAAGPTIPATVAVVGAAAAALGTPRADEAGEALA